MLYLPISCHRVESNGPGKATAKTKEHLIMFSDQKRMNICLSFKELSEKRMPVCSAPFSQDATFSHAFDQV